MALVAAREALAMAGVQPAALGRRLGLIFATCSGPMLLIEDHYERMLCGDFRLSAEQLLSKRYYSGAEVLARVLGIRGFTTTVANACSASTAAMALAADLIRCGMLDAALAGGADAFSISTLAGFEGLKATCEGKCAPFSKPLGLNLGEAAGFVFLETTVAAEARGARMHAELLGSGTSNDAYHCSAPEPTGRGLAAAMKRALADAGLTPEQVSYINAHGTGTEANDKAECKAVRRVFAERAERIPMSSTKSLIGHCLGAAGAMELAATVVCAEAGVLPPTANFSGPREGCAVDCVPDVGRAWPEPRVFLSNNAAFGGHNASLIVAVPPAAASLGLPGDEAQETIVVTGCGVVSALGIGREALLHGKAAGQSAIQPVSLPGLPPLLAGRVNEESAARYDRRLDLRGMDRSSRWATLATRLAIRDAGYPETQATLAELGLILSLSAGPSEAENAYLTSFLKHDRRVAQLADFPYLVPNSVAGQVCRALRLAGHNLTLSAGVGAGLFGLGAAVSALRSRHMKALLCGAVDELSDRILADMFAADQLCHNGTPPGEGAAVLMLETERYARERGAKPLAAIRGVAWGASTTSDESIAPTSLEELVEDALSQAKLQRSEVGQVCSHGSRTAFASLAARLHPAWRDCAVSTAGHTGWLEGAQPLLDFVAFKVAGGPALAVVAAPSGPQAAVVFELFGCFFG
jgi:3-oxoacyl-[acyl-carrier-protein] synthase II